MIGHFVGFRPARIRNLSMVQNLEKKDLESEMTFDLYRYDISDLNLESDLELFRFIHATNRLKPKISPDKLDQLCIKSKKSNILYQF